MNTLLVVSFLAFFIGIGAGSALGAWYARAQRGWADYRGTKRSLPKLLRLAWQATGFVAVSVLVAVAGALLVYALATASGAGR